MQKHIKIFLIFALLIFSVIFAKFTKEYYENKTLKKLIFQEEAKSLNNFVVAFRRVYQDIFIEQNIALTHQTIACLPVHSLSKISERFSELSGKKVIIRTISDNPRNPHNLANHQEMPILQAFQKSKAKEPYFAIEGSKLFEITPLYIEQSCLRCHGKKEDAPPTIQKNYMSAFDYKIGDLRGAISIEISKHDIIEKIDKNFHRGLFVATIVYCFFMSAVFLLIREIRNNEKKYATELEEKVERQVGEIRIQEKLLLQQSKLASMGEMIGNIAHQWRQPLSTISTCASGMKIQKENEMLEDQFFYDSCDMIVFQVKYLSKTIDDFRDYLKTNKTKSIFTVDALISNTMSIISPSLKHSDIALVYTNTVKKLQIESFHNELTQVILNIFNNAKDAINATLLYDKKLIFCDVEQKNELVLIHIYDNGGGIKEEIMDKIFEPYFTTKHQSQGTGLGLFMAYKIVTESLEGSLQAHNTHFVFEDIPYIGASFKIVLPLK